MGDSVGRARIAGKDSVILGKGVDQAGAAFEIWYCPQPSLSVRDGIVAITRKLTPKWFTARVPSDAEKDILFQRVIVYMVNGQVAGFIVFTCLDGAPQITLMGTDPSQRFRGIGTTLLGCLRDIALELQFSSIRVFTKPPETNPDYVSTMAFYRAKGFREVKRYKELWEDGAVELEWSISQA